MEIIEFFKIFFDKIEKELIFGNFILKFQNFSHKLFNVVQICFKLLKIVENLNNYRKHFEELLLTN